MNVTEQDARRIVEYKSAEVGRERPALGLNSVITEDALRRFVRGYGDDEARWLRPSASPPIVPPTFLFSFVSHTRSVAITDPSGATVWHGFWYIDHWQNRRHVRLGEPVVASVRMAAIEPSCNKRGVPRIDVAMESRFSVHGELVATYRQTNRYVPVGAAERPPLERSIPHRYQDAAIVAMAERYAEERRRESVPDLLLLGEDRRVPVLQKGPMSITEQVCWVMGAGAPFVESSRNMYEFLAVLDPTERFARLRNHETNAPDMPDGIHWDAAVARDAGMPTGYDRGPQRTAWFAHAITDWLGTSVLVEELETRIFRPNFMGDLAFIEGEVTSQTEERSLELILRSTNQVGDVTATARARVVAGWPAGKRDKGKGRERP